MSVSKSISWITFTVFIIHPLLLTTHHSPLTIHHGLFTIICCLLTAAFSAFFNQVFLYKISKYLYECQIETTIMKQVILSILLNNNFLPIKYVITIFLTDFIIRVFINPKFSPILIIGRLIVGNQVPEYVGAQQ